MSQPSISPVAPDARRDNLLRGIAQTNDANVDADDHARYLAMTADEVGAIKDAALQSLVIRLRTAMKQSGDPAGMGRRVTGARSGLQFIVREPVADSLDAEAEQFTAQLNAENRAKSLRNALRKFSTADLAAPADQQIEAFRLLAEWAANPDPEIVFLHGSVGGGKTHAAAATAMRVAGPRKVPSMVRWEDLTDAWMSGSEFTSHDLLKERARTIDKVRNARVLIVDDLYRRKPTEHVSAEMSALIERRQGNDQLTIVTSNVAPLDTEEGEAFVNTYPFTERVMDRLMEARIVHMDGASLRGRI